jgi:hypothetical protein
MPVVHYYLGRPASAYAVIRSRRPLAESGNGRVRRASDDAELVAFGVAHDNAPAARAGHPPRLSGAGGR